MKAKLVHKNTHQRFYKIPCKINKAPNPDFKWDTEFEHQKTKLKKEHTDEFIEKYPDGVDIICISDAHTHTERLAFLGVEISGQYGRFSLQADGKHTFMIHGGNERDVHPDEVYIRRIFKANRLNFEGVE